MDKQKYLVFLDIDGTLLDIKYDSNAPELAHLIEKLQKKQKISFALNSNRSLEDMIPIANKFGINGSLVCENGLYIYDINTRKKIYLLDKSNLKILTDAKNKFKYWLLGANSIFKQSIDYIQTDTVNLNQDDWMNSINSDITVFDNIYRRFTISAHVKKKDRNSLIKNPEGMILIAESIRKKYIDAGFEQDIEISTSLNHCNILMYSKRVNKGSGVAHLMLNAYKGYKLIAIGDSSEDYQMVRNRGDFWTVGNATPEAKKLASQTSSGFYAKGVKELLIKNLCFQRVNDGTRN